MNFSRKHLRLAAGLLGALSHLDLVVPLVAVASFAIAAVAIGLLVRVSTRAAQGAAYSRAAVMRRRATRSRSARTSR